MTNESRRVGKWSAKLLKELFSHRDYQKFCQAESQPEMYLITVYISCMKNEIELYIFSIVKS